jgi:hypothetical protein
MAYNFTDKSLAEFLNFVFNVTNGHDHDGTNSKAVTTGTPGAGVITKTMFAAGALAADATGRAVVAGDFFNEATFLAKFAADSITNANLLKAVLDGAFQNDAATRLLFADSIWTLAKLSATAKTKHFVYQVEDLAADGDIAARAIMEVPTGFVYTIVSATIISNGTAAGIDGSNTCAVALKNGTNAICTETFTDVAPFPANNTSSSMGAISGTYGVMAAGTKLILAVTNGSTANPPGFQVQVIYTVADA